jgi:hypothetical protein
LPFGSAIIGRVNHRALPLILGALLISTPALAQFGERTGFSLVGLWSPMFHEDELERTDPGPPPGDYTGFPLNEAGRMHADSWHPDLAFQLEHQCIPHPAPYSLRGPASLSIRAISDSSSERVAAYAVEGTYGGATRTIWLNGRPHPSKFAAHTFGGFSTGTWEGDTLKVVTTHIKAGYLRRNGIMHTDQVQYREFFTLHDKYLTVMTVVEEPVYLTEPLVRTESFVWNPFMAEQGPHAYGATCQPGAEIPRPYGWVPHQLPGTNMAAKDYSESWGVPLDATRGGAETMYPEYRKKLKTMPIPRPKIFESKFAREHRAKPATGQDKNSEPNTKDKK